MSGPVLVGGSVLQRPLAGGHAWAVASWALGLRRLGYSVVWLDHPPEGNGPARATTVALDPETMARTGLPPAPAGRGEPLHEAAALFNLMGFVAPDRDAGDDWPDRAVFVDIDPGYPQMWHALGLADMLDGHSHFVTVGENVGAEDCPIPTCGRDWLTTPPPVVLSAWPVTDGGSAYTTVATWRNAYGTVAWDGATYGSRVSEFRQFMELPRLVDVDFELALDIDAAEVDDLRRLEAAGWRLADPVAVAGTPASYRAYLQQSRAELCVAQNMYVATRSGWLSDRSLCYLASGKPVLAQDTGFADRYPVGEGLLAFSTVEEAAAGVEEIERNYERHSAAARALAEEHFDSDKVLSSLLDRLGIAGVTA